MGFRGGMNQPTLRAPFFAAPTVTGPWIRGALIASATQGDSTGPVTVVVPQGTPPLRRRPETREEALRHALDLIPGYAFEQTMRPVPPDHSERTLVGDARDLFVHVVRKATGVSLDSRSWDHPGLLDAAPGSQSWPGDASIFSGPVFIHLGENPITTSVLRSHGPDINPQFITPHDDTEPYLGLRRVFDADGFALVRVFESGRLHIMVLGGSDYGTYYGVATLLRETLGVRWIFPGDLGEVVPRTGSYEIRFGEPIGATLLYDPLFNYYQEPDFRGRSMDLLSRSVKDSAPEIDAVRTWALNNRLHPADERIYLRQIALGTDACRSPLPLLWTELGKEVRIPSNHALHDLLSPFDPDRASQAGAPSGVATPVGIARPDFYPDVRPRYSLGAAYDIDYVGASRPVAGTPRFLGAPIAAAFTRPGYGRDAARCSTDLPEASWWPAAGGTSSDPWRLSAMVLDGTAVKSSIATHANSIGGGGYLQRYISREIFSFIDERRGLFRALPRCARTLRMGRDRPGAVSWKPCVYGHATVLREGEVPPVNLALSLQVTASLAPALQFLRSTSVRGEAVASVAPNDGVDGWCLCDACSMSSTSSSQGSFGGANLRPGAAVEQLRLNAGLPLFYDLPNDVNMPSRDPSGFDAFFQRTWFDRTAPCPDADEASARGYLMSFCCPDLFSRRVADLTRAVGALLGSRADDVYVTTHAYQQWRGAPMSGDIRRYLREERVVDGESLHLGPRVVPFVTSTADVAEYGRDPRIASFDPGLPASLLQYYYPRQFNEMRWSVFAAQYGLYEYMYGAFIYMVPRLYSGQLRVALTRAHRRRARAFNAETTPMWSTEGPKWFETAEMLWRLMPSEGLPSGVPEQPSPRRVWAERVLSDEESGIVAESMVDELVAIYDAIESRWLEAVRLAEWRNRRRRSDELYQPSLVNIEGAINEPWQLDAFEGTSASYLRVVGDLNAPSDLFARMLDLQAWFDRGFPSSVQRARERLALLVAGMAPVAALARASRPVRLAYRLTAPPPQFTQGWPRNNGPLLPSTGNALYAPSQVALQQIYDWVINPASYTRAIHFPLQDALIAGGVITRVPSRRTWPQLALARELTTNALGTAWLKVDPSAVRGYVDAWNSATYLDEFKSMAFERAASGAIASMVRSIKAWVIEFATFMRGNDQSEFERFVRPSDPFRMSLDRFEGQA